MLPPLIQHTWHLLLATIILFHLTPSTLTTSPIVLVQGQADPGTFSVTSTLSCAFTSTWSDTNSTVKILDWTPFFAPQSYSLYKATVGNVVACITANCTITSGGTLSYSFAGATTLSSPLTALAPATNCLVLSKYQVSYLNLTSSQDGSYQFQIFSAAPEVNVTLTGVMNHPSFIPASQLSGYNRVMTPSLKQLEGSTAGSLGFKHGCMNYSLTVPYGIGTIYLGINNVTNATVTTDNLYYNPNTTLYYTYPTSTDQFFTTATSAAVAASTDLEVGVNFQCLNDYTVLTQVKYYNDTSVAFLYSNTLTIWNNTDQTKLWTFTVSGGSSGFNFITVSPSISLLKGYNYTFSMNAPKLNSDLATVVYPFPSTAYGCNIPSYANTTQMTLGWGGGFFATGLNTFPNTWATDGSGACWQYWLDVVAVRTIYSPYYITTYTLIGNITSLDTTTGLSPIYSLRVGDNPIHINSLMDGLYTFTITRADATMSNVVVSLYDGYLSPPLGVSGPPLNVYNNYFQSDLYDHYVNVSANVASISVKISFQISGIFGSGSFASYGAYVDMAGGSSWFIQNNTQGPACLNTALPSLVYSFQHGPDTNLSLVMSTWNGTSGGLNILRLVTNDGVYGWEISRTPPIITNITWTGQTSLGATAPLQMSPMSPLTNRGENYFSDWNSTVLSWVIRVPVSVTSVSLTAVFNTGPFYNDYGINSTVAAANGGNGPTNSYVTWYDATALLTNPLASPTNKSLLTSMSSTSFVPITQYGETLFFVYDDEDGEYSFLFIHAAPVLTGIVPYYGQGSLFNTNQANFLQYPNNVTTAMTPATFTSGLVTQNYTFGSDNTLWFVNDLVSFNVTFTNVSTKADTFVIITRTYPASTLITTSVQAYSGVRSLPLALAPGLNTFSINCNVDGAYTVNIYRAVPSINPINFLALNTSYDLTPANNSVYSLPANYFINNSSYWSYNDIGGATYDPTLIFNNQLYGNSGVNGVGLIHFNVSYVVGSIIPNTTFISMLGFDSLTYEFVPHSRLVASGLVFTVNYTNSTAYYDSYTGMIMNSNLFFNTTALYARGRPSFAGANFTDGLGSMPTGGFVLEVGFNLIRIFSTRDGSYDVLINRAPRNLQRFALRGSGWTGSELYEVLDPTSSTGGQFTSNGTSLGNFYKKYPTIYVPFYVQFLSVEIEYGRLESSTSHGPSGPVISNEWVCLNNATDCIAAYGAGSVFETVENYPNGTYPPMWQNMLLLNYTINSNVSQAPVNLLHFISDPDGVYTIQIIRRGPLLSTIQLYGFDTRDILTNTAYTNNTWLLGPGVNPQTNTQGTMLDLFVQTQLNQTCAITVPFSVNKIAFEVVYSNGTLQTSIIPPSTAISNATVFVITNGSTALFPTLGVQLQVGVSTVLINSTADGPFTCTITRTAPDLTGLFIQADTIYVGETTMAPYNSSVLPLTPTPVIPTTFVNSSFTFQPQDYGLSATFVYRYNYLTFHLNCTATTSIFTSTDLVTFSPLNTPDALGYCGSAVPIDFLVTQPLSVANSYPQIINYRVESLLDGNYTIQLTRLAASIQGIQFNQTLSADDQARGVPLPTVVTLPMIPAYVPGFVTQQFGVNTTSQYPYLSIGWNFSVALGAFTVELTNDYGFQVFTVANNSVVTTFPIRPASWAYLNIVNAADGNYSIAIYSVSGWFNWTYSTLPTSLYANEQSSPMVLEVFNPNCTNPQMVVVCNASLPAWHGDFFYYNVSAWNDTSMTGMVFNGSLTSQAMIYTASSLLPPQLVTQITITCAVTGPDAYKFDPVPPVTIQIKPQSPFNLSTLPIAYPIGSTALTTGSFINSTQTGIESLIAPDFFVYSGEYFALNFSVTEVPNDGKNITLFGRMNCINVGAIYIDSTTQGYCDPDFFSAGVAATLNPVADPSVTISYINATTDGPFNYSSPYQIWFQAPTVLNATNISLVFYLKGSDKVHYNVDIINSWSGTYQAGILIPIKPRVPLSWQNIPINMTINQVYSLTSMALLEQPNDNFGRLRGVPNSWGFNLSVVVTPSAGLLPVTARYPTFFLGLPPSSTSFTGLPSSGPINMILIAPTQPSYVTLSFVLTGRDRVHYIPPPPFSFPVSPYGKLLPIGICTYFQLFGSCTFSIVMDQQPFRNGYMNVTGVIQPDGLMSPTSFSFDYTNWNIPQTVTIFAPTSTSSPAFNLATSSVGFPAVDVSFVLTGPNNYQYAPFKNVSVLLLSQVHIRDLPQTLYVNQISPSPIIVQWDGLAYGSVSLNAVISPSNYGYLSTVPLTYVGALTTENILVHAPTNLGGGSTLTLTFSLSGPDAGKFEPVVYLAPKLVSGVVTYVQTNSFVINLAAQDYVTISGVPSSLYTNEVSSAITFTLSAPLTPGSGSLQIVITSFLGTAVAGSFSPASPITFFEGGATSITTTLIAPSTSGNLAVSFTLGGNDAAHYYLTPTGFFSVTIKDQLTIAFGATSFPSAGVSSTAISMIGMKPTISPPPGQAIVVTVTPSSGSVSPSSLTFTSFNYYSSQSVAFTPPSLPSTQASAQVTFTFSVKLTNATGYIFPTNSFSQPAAQVLTLNNPNYVPPVVSSSSSTGVSSSSSSSTGISSSSSSSTGIVSSSSTGSSNSTNSTTGGQIGGLSSTGSDTLISTSSSPISSNNLIIIFACAGGGLIILLLIGVVVLRRRHQSEMAELSKREFMGASPSTSNEASRSGTSIQLSTLRSNELKSVADGLVTNAKPTTYGAAAVHHSIAQEEEAEQERIQALVRAKVAAKIRAKEEEARLNQEKESSVVRVDDGEGDDEGEGSVVKNEPEDNDGIPLHSVRVHTTASPRQAAFRPPPSQTAPFRPGFGNQPLRAQPFSSASTARPTTSPLMNPAYRPPPPMAYGAQPRSPSNSRISPSNRVGPVQPQMQQPQQQPQPLFQTRQPSRSNLGPR